LKKWEITGFLAVFILLFLLISGCTQDNSKYCSDNFPGTYYDPTSKMCEHTLEPTPITTPILIPTSVLTSVPTIVTTQVPIKYLQGKFDGCYCDKDNFKICIEDKPKVSINGNNVSASGTIIYKQQSTRPDPSCQPQSSEVWEWGQREKSVSVSLKIYDNNNVKVAGISKKYSVDQNGKTLIILNTTLPENNPIGWTYRLSVEKDLEEVNGVYICPSGYFKGIDGKCYPTGSELCNCGGFVYCVAGGQCCNGQWIQCPAGSHLGIDCYCYK
jgi:hypothetical protein